MNKKILIGSIIAVAILLLMPSIPAVHINSIENQIKTEYKELLLNEGVNFKIPDKLPLLYLLVYILGYFRAYRSDALFAYSIEIDDWGEIKLIHPFLLLRSLILMASVNLWVYGWLFISDILGWDWEIP